MLFQERSKTNRFRNIRNINLIFASIIHNLLLLYCLLPLYYTEQLVIIHKVSVARRGQWISKPDAPNGTMKLIAMLMNITYDHNICFCYTFLLCLNQIPSNSIITNLRYNVDSLYLNSNWNIELYT